MDLSLKIGGFKPAAFLQKIKANIFLFFWLVFFAVIVFEFLAIKTSFEFVFKRPEIQPAKRSKGIRIDFENYYNAVKKINGAASFRPSAWQAGNPFKPK